MNYKKNRSESFSIRTSKGSCRANAPKLELLWGGLPSEIALQGASPKSKIVYHYREVGTDFEKPTKTKISARNEQVSRKRGKKWFPKKL